jgi:hypothetical protein
MRMLHAGIGLLTAALLTIPAVHAQEKQKKKKDTANSRVATDQDYVQLGKMKDVTGLLTTFDDKLLTIRVEYQTYELKNPKDKGKKNNPNSKAAREAERELREQQRFLREYQDILRIRNAGERQRRLLQLQARMQRDQMGDLWRLMQQQDQFNQGKLGNPGANSPYKVVTASVEFELPVLDDLKVARAEMGIEYDDKGKVIEYKPEELKKLRHPTLPGYKAKVEDVMPGMTVKLYLAKSRKAEKAKAKPKEGEDDAIELPTDSRPQVRAILILSEPDISFQPKQPKKENKKKKKN